MKQISKLIREMIPVIMGILIALLINNWNESRKNEKYLNKIFSYVKDELAESQADITEKLPKQQVLLDSIERYLNDESVSLYEIIRKTKGVQLVTINNSSWKALANTKIELVDYEKLSTLSYIDEEKEGLKVRAEKIYDFMITNANETSPEKKEIFKILIQDMIWAEEGVQPHIEAVINN